MGRKPSKMTRVIADMKQRLDPSATIPLVVPVETPVQAPVALALPDPVDDFKATAELMLTTREAARYIGCCQNHVRLSIKWGRIRAVKRPYDGCAVGYRWLIPQSEAKRFRDTIPEVGRPRGAHSEKKNKGNKYRSLVRKISD
jgi:hypothetical protein